MSEYYILQKIAELGKMSINFDPSVDYYLIGVEGYVGYYVKYFNEETLFNALVNLTSQKALKEKWWKVSE